MKALLHYQRLRFIWLAKPVGRHFHRGPQLWTSLTLADFEAINRCEKPLPKNFNFAADVLDQWSQKEKVRDSSRSPLILLLCLPCPLTVSSSHLSGSNGFFVSARAGMRMAPWGLTSTKSPYTHFFPTSVYLFVPLGQLKVQGDGVRLTQPWKHAPSLLKKGKPPEGVCFQDG